LPMWSVYAILLLAAIIISFMYMKVAGPLVYGDLKNNSFTKENLFIYATIPLVFAFEIAYQLKPLLTRLGHLLPTLGRQFGFNWEFLDFTYPASSVTPWQIILILIGLLVSFAISTALRKNHQRKSDDPLQKRFRKMPFILLSIIYIFIVLVR